MQIAFVTTSLFGRAGNGGELCSARLLGGLLRAGHAVHVIGRGPLPAAADGLDREGLSFRSLGARVPAFDSLPLARRVGSLVGACLAHQASTVYRLGANDAAPQVAGWMAARHFDAIVVDHLQAQAWIGNALPQVPRLLMMHNLESEGYDESARDAAAHRRLLSAAIYRREAALLQALEVDALRSAAAIACLSDGDAEVLRRRARDCGARAPVWVLPGFPLAADRWADELLDAVAAAPGTSPHPDHAATVAGGLRRVGMLGTWTWRSNREGLEWMLTQVLPQLPPGHELVLAGRGLPATAASPRVRLLGYVDDVQSFYDAVDVVALPSWTGSGVHEKAIEAVARANVVVATPHALRGLGTALPSHIHVAERPEDFARFCARAGPGPTAADGALAWAAQRRQAYGAALACCLQALGDVPQRRLVAS